ncbi:MAG TPA: hypothetical protein VFN56_03460 [Candidatus Saccharimonadales bacterium]|nr:hypothetical protein [Candidatus Saccharimonadales bacterium]
MDTQKENAIRNTLETNKAQHIPFYQTQQQLLKQGYTESEIVYAMYSVSYDQTSNQPKPAHPLDQLYAEHPEQAQEIAKTLLQSQRQDDWNATTLDLVAGNMGPDLQTASYYDLLAADRLGIPYFTITLIPFAIALLAIKFNWPASVAHTVFSLFSLFVSLLFAVKLIHERIRIKKMKPKV